MLENIEGIKFYRFLQINSVNRVVNILWNGEADILSTPFELATSYDLTFNNSLSYKEDRERKSRFYVPRDFNKDIKPHSCSFSVWKRSLSLRYGIEALIYIVIMLVFQLQVSSFNTDLQTSALEITLEKAMREEIENRNLEAIPKVLLTEYEEA